mgnify:CR=1 FL=1
MAKPNGTLTWSPSCTSDNPCEGILGYLLITLLVDGHGNREGEIIVNVRSGVGLIPFPNLLITIEPTILVKTEAPRIVRFHLPWNALDDSTGDRPIPEILSDLVDDTVVEVVELVSSGVRGEPVESIVMLGNPILERVDHRCGNEANSGQTFHGPVGFLSNAVEREPIQILEFVEDLIGPLGTGVVLPMTPPFLEDIGTHNLSSDDLHSDRPPVNRSRYLDTKSPPTRTMPP